jgi:hypothetical protein
MTKRYINFFFAKYSGICDQLYFHGHDSHGDREIEAFHCFNGATEVEGLNITTRISHNGRLYTSQLVPDGIYF